jgi:hypothetical protein
MQGFSLGHALLNPGKEVLARAMKITSVVSSTISSGSTVADNPPHEGDTRMVVQVQKRYLP